MNPVRKHWTEVEWPNGVPSPTEKTPSTTDWDEAERKAARNQGRRCTFCGEKGHRYVTCPKYLARSLGQ